MDNELNELYQQVILDHCRKPRNFHVMAGEHRAAEGKNPLCGDNFTIYLQVEGETIRDMSFQGAGCCISKASASMMTDELKGKSIAAARAYFSQYQNMVTTGKMDEEAMGKLCAFAGVHHFPMRVKCAILPWHAMLAGLDGQTSVSTEVH
ncbi:MAG TPA: SUF system NifU family Fe-S cluster assembly protein [Verrucomicrobiae bacterium]|jgi:nitrogen fixation NifU-like protein|nr:SUF system NifU family Fe-S cluster assembly protein [Verrucomicrobiae bacterium]